MKPRLPTEEGLFLVCCALAMLALALVFLTGCNPIAWTSPMGVNVWDVGQPDYFEPEELDSAFTQTVTRLNSLGRWDADRVEAAAFSPWVAVLDEIPCPWVASGKCDALLTGGTIQVQAFARKETALAGVVHELTHWVLYAVEPASGGDQGHRDEVWR